MNIFLIDFLNVSLHKTINRDNVMVEVIKRMYFAPPIDYDKVMRKRIRRNKLDND